MSTIEQAPITGELVANNIHQPIKFDVTNEAIRALTKKYHGYKADTPTQYLAVKAGIAEVRDLRVGVDKKRKEIKEDALKYGRMVDGEAERIRLLLVAIEEPLKAERDRADNAKEEAKRLAAEAKQRALQFRVDALALAGNWTNPVIVEAWSEDQYSQALLASIDEWEAKCSKEASDKLESERVEAERVEAVRQEKLKMDAERLELEKQRADMIWRQTEQDAIAKEYREAIETERKAIEAEREQANRIQLEALQKEREALKAERDRIAKEDFDRQAKIQADADELERIEQERIDAAELVEYEAEQSRLSAIAAKQEAERLESLKPDIQKIRAFGDLLRLVPYPTCTTREGVKFVGEIKDKVWLLSNFCRDFA